MPVLIGTSGWQYADWRGRFYPAGFAQANWLEYYASRFGTVEVNSAFYRLPAPETFERWKTSTPEDFKFGVKASRYLTHVRRLREPAPAVERLVSAAAHLGSKLGPILLQLPANFRCDLDALRATLEAFPRGVRVAFEPRHSSWYVEEVATLLAEYDAALCLTDTPRGRAPVWRTTGWGYVRFHAGRASPSPCYGRTALRSWAERLAELWTNGDDCYAYFNNDQGGCAVRDAHRFALATSKVGLTPTRVPTAREASLRMRSG